MPDFDTGNLQCIGAVPADGQGSQVPGRGRGSLIAGSTADGIEPACVDARQSRAPLAPMRGESQLRAWQGWWEQLKCTQLDQQLAARGTGRGTLIFRTGNHPIPRLPLLFLVLFYPG